MAYAVVTNRVDQSLTGNGYTSGSFNATGANLLVVAVTDNGGTAVVTDSLGNTWTQLTPSAFGGTDSVAIWYAKNATVGSGQTYSVSGTTNYPASCLIALSGADTSSPFDVENGGVGLFPPLSPGSVTPGSANEIVITAMRTSDGAASIDLGFTITDQAAPVGGQSTGPALAYLIQTSASAVAPTWTTTSFGNAAVIATFKAGAGGGSPTITDVNTTEVVLDGATGMAVTGTGMGTTNADRAFTLRQTGATSVTQTETGTGTATAATLTISISTTIKFGATTLRCTLTSGGATGDIAITVNPPSGQLYIDIGTPAASGSDRITATGDLASGDQVQARGVGGGAVPTGLTLYTDGTFGFTSGNTPAPFDVRIYDGSTFDWGAWATQSIAGAQRRSMMLLGVGR